MAIKELVSVRLKTESGGHYLKYSKNPSTWQKCNSFVVWK